MGMFQVALITYTHLFASPQSDPGHASSIRLTGNSIMYSEATVNDSICASILAAIDKTPVMSIICSTHLCAVYNTDMILVHSTTCRYHQNARIVSASHTIFYCADTFERVGRNVSPIMLRGLSCQCGNRVFASPWQMMFTARTVTCSNIRQTAAGIVCRLCDSQPAAHAANVC